MWLFGSVEPVGQLGRLGGQAIARRGLGWLSPSRQVGFVEEDRAAADGIRAAGRGSILMERLGAAGLVLEATAIAIGAARRRAEPRLPGA